MPTRGISGQALERAIAHCVALRVHVFTRETRAFGRSPRSLTAPARKPCSGGSTCGPGCFGDQQGRCQGCVHCRRASGYLTEMYGTRPPPKGAMNVVQLPFPTRTRTVLWSMWLGWYSIWIDYVSPTCRSPPSLWAMRQTRKIHDPG